MEERFWYLLTHYLSHESSLEENEELKDLISSEPRYKQLFEQHGGLWNDIVKNKHQVHFDKDKIKSKVLSNVSLQKAQEVKSSSFNLWKYAAIIILLIACGAVFYAGLESENQVTTSPFISKTTGANQRAMVTLKDGTEVWLQENSSLTYAEDLIREGERRVQLIGEAFFNVTKNKEFPFIVKTGAVSTKVLGTSFNVRAFPEDNVEVTVATGKVRVSNQLTGVALEPDEQAVINRLTNNIQKQKIQADHVTLWKNPELTFNRVSLKEAFFMLSRYYNVKINVDDVSDLSCPVRAKYRGESLETVLEGLQLIFDFKYQFIHDKQIKITGSGCQTKAIGI